MKLQPEDILKPGVDIKAIKLDPDDPLVKSPPEYSQRQQEIILHQTHIDWNNPQLYEPMPNFPSSIPTMDP